MNRYVADGILDDVVSGKRVLLVSEGGLAAAHALEEIERRAVARSIELLTIRRSHGSEGVTHASGGRVHIVSARGRGGRGVVVDVLFVDADLTFDRLADLMPCVAVTRGEAMLR